MEKGKLVLKFFNIAVVYQAAIKKCPFSVAVKNNLVYPKCTYIYIIHP